MLLRMRDSISPPCEVCRALAAVLATPTASETAPGRLITRSGESGKRKDPRGSPRVLSFTPARSRAGGSVAGGVVDTLVGGSAVVAEPLVRLRLREHGESAGGGAGSEFDATVSGVAGRLPAR